MINEVCFFIISFVFRAFGVHSRGPGGPLAPFWPLGTPRAIQELICFLFFIFFWTFAPLWESKGRPKEPQGAKRRPKWCPKCSPREPKVTPKTDFFEIRETLIFDDSTMKIIGFWCPGGSLGRPKSGKKHEI